LLIQEWRLVLLASAVKLLAEIALMALAGQFLLGLLAGAKRETNFFYKLLQIITNPVTRSARWLAPRVVLDRHVPLVAFLLAGFVWLAATLFKISLCVEAGVQTCR
jgi:hypothetical protein